MAEPQSLSRGIGTGPVRARNPLASFGSVADVDAFETPSVADCNPGLEPVEYNVIVAPSIRPHKIGSIHLPDESQERLEMAMQMGRIIAMSPIAWNYDTWPDDAQKPGVGDIVWFAKYAGGVFVGRDGKDYRIVKDKDCGAIIERAAK